MSHRIYISVCYVFITHTFRSSKDYAGQRDTDPAAPSGILVFVSLRLLCKKERGKDIQKKNFLLQTNIHIQF